MTPDFEELVGTDLEPEERDRLRRAHDLLVAAGPLPELPPGLADPMGPPEAEVIPFWNRRRNAAIAVLAAALAALAFGVGYLTGHTKSDKGFTEGAIVMRGTVAAPDGASARSSSARRTTPATGRCSSASRTSHELRNGAYYTLWLTKKGTPVAPCGSFLVRGGDASDRGQVHGRVQALELRRLGRDAAEAAATARPAASCSGLERSRARRGRSRRTPRA